MRGSDSKIDLLAIDDLSVDSRKSSLGNQNKER